MRAANILSREFDERNEAVKILIKQTIEVCNEMGKYVGICGQAPSDFPDFAGLFVSTWLAFFLIPFLSDFLVKCGIQSISLNPDRCHPSFLLTPFEHQ